MRSGELYAIVRCGDTGLRGRGGHAHNDQLSFELCAGSQPMVVDPGAFVYTADPAARNLFRSTAFHATLQVDGREQNELRDDALFVMPDRSRAECVDFGGSSFEGRHHGFEPAVHTRRIEMTSDGLTIDDRVEGGGAHELQWTFPLAPGAQVRVEGSRVIAEWPGGSALTIEADGVDFAIEDGWYSPRYGVREPTPFVRARVAGAGSGFSLRVR
jgi:uncharacterized heparinase superfamily protein